MKPAIRNYLPSLMLMFTLLLTGAYAPGQSAHKLLAHGDQNEEWVAQISPSEFRTDTASRETLLWNRRVNGAWSALETIDGRGISLGNVGPELAALLAEGDWVIASSQIGNRAGPPAPARLLALASDGDTLWALGQITAGSAGHAPATAPAASLRAPGARALGPGLAATSTAEVESASSRPAEQGPELRPATVPSATWVLLKLERGYWTMQSPALDSAFSTSGENPTLCVVGGQAFVAAMIDNQLRVLSLATPRPAASTQPAAGGAAWTSVADLPVEGKAAQWKLLGASPAPVLWMAGDAQDLGSLRFGPSLQNRVDLQRGAASATAGSTTRNSINLGTIEDKAIMSGGNRIRLVLLNKDGKLLEQVYEGIPGANFGQPIGSLSEIELPAPPTPNLFPWIAGSAAMAGVALALAWINRAQRAAPGVKVELDEEEADDIGSGERTVLAPLSLRLAAGILDAAPLVLALMFSNDTTQINSSQAFPDLVNPQILLPALIGLVAYLVHTTLSELICGASLGKLVFGLRVVDRQGAAPASWRLAVRNLLRLPDCLIIPLAFAAFTPLRQRLGDQVAGTIVVLNPSLHKRVVEAQNDE